MGRFWFPFEKSYLSRFCCSHYSPSEHCHQVRQMLFLALGIPNTKNHTSLPKSNSFCNMLQYPSTKRRYYNNAVNFMPSSLLSFYFFLFLSLSQMVSSFLLFSPFFSLPNISPLSCPTLAGAFFFLGLRSVFFAVVGLRLVAVVVVGSLLWVFIVEIRDWWLSLFLHFR